jgi:glycine cleavage system H protein
VESVKAASDVYAPISGQVLEGNGALGDAPETVNEQPEGSGWFAKIKISDPEEYEALMDRAAYDAFLGTL